MLFYRNNFDGIFNTHLESVESTHQYIFLCINRSSKGAKQGCFTDKLADGKLITIPILANFCSKLCAVDSSLDTIHECPYEGFIHQKIDPELQRKIAE